MRTTYRSAEPTVPYRGSRRSTDTRGGERRLVAIAVKELGGRAVHGYGKGGIVGMKGELEHVAAMLHPKFGTPLREGVGGGKAIIPSAKKRGGPGTSLDVPLHYKDAAFVRSPVASGKISDVDISSAQAISPWMRAVFTSSQRPFSTWREGRLARKASSTSSTVP